MRFRTMQPNLAPSDQSRGRQPATYRGSNEQTQGAVRRVYDDPAPGREPRTGGSDLAAA